MKAPDITRLLRDFAPLIARVAATYEKDTALQEDLIQDISLSIWRALDSTEGSKNQFREEPTLKTYIARIAHNRAVDHVIKEQRSNATSEEYDESSDTFSTPAYSHEQVLDLMSGLHKLKINYRQVIALQLEGFSYPEIATTLGLSEDAVAQRASRAKQQLAKLMNRS